MSKTVLALILAVIGSSIAAPSLQPVIINGTQASIYDYPWAVSFRYLSIHQCGGVLISDQWALTAGHCYGAVIQYGVNTLSRNGNLMPTLLHVHPDFNNVTLENDIALLKLERPVEFADNVQPAKLPLRNSEITAPSWTQSANVVGYGVEDPSLVLAAEYLKEAELKVITNEDCRSLIDGALFDTQLCAGVEGGYRGYCRYDSGGPLTLPDGTLIGIISNGILSCSDSERPNVFTKVSRYIDWIEATTGLKFD